MQIPGGVASGMIKLNVHAQRFCRMKLRANRRACEPGVSVENKLIIIPLLPLNSARAKVYIGSDINI